jgi:hypothetical protein
METDTTSTPHREAADFAAETPPFEIALAFAHFHAKQRRDFDHADATLPKWDAGDDAALAEWRAANPTASFRAEAEWKLKRGKQRPPRPYFFWINLAWDLRRRYGGRGRRIFDAGCAGYPVQNRDLVWRRAGERQEPFYGDESLTTRLRPWLCEHGAALIHAEFMAARDTAITNAHWERTESHGTVERNPSWPWSYETKRLYVQWVNSTLEHNARLIEWNEFLESVEASALNLHDEACRKFGGFDQ